MTRISIAILVGCLNIFACNAQQKPTIDGRYTLTYLLPSGEHPVVGHLTLNTENYSFEFDKNYKKSESAKVSYPPFCVAYPSGKFAKVYSQGISETTDLKTLTNHAAIFRIRLNASEREIYQSTIKFNKERNSLYFHSEGSGVQMWSLEKENTSDKIETVDAFVKACQQECSTSPLRYKSNISGNSEPTDQCALIKHYADMIFKNTENAFGAKLILKDVCPQAVSSVK